MAEALSRLAGPANVANGTATAFTGTAAHTYSIRGIIIANNTTGPITVKVGIGGVTDAVLIIPATSIAAGSTLVFDTLVVMSGTETLQTNATATGTTMTVSGLDQS
jgi:hypothetical protein